MAKPRKGEKHDAFRHWNEITPEYEPPYKPKILKEWPKIGDFTKENLELRWV